MKNYLELMQKVYEHGKRHENRTGVATRRLIGAQLDFNLQEGFPAMTTKKLAFKSVVGELLGFIHGYTNAADFRRLGCNIWDANANENKAWLANPNRSGTDDLGRIYGAQWSSWIGMAPNGTLVYVDQLMRALYEIQNNPSSRRILISAWQPAELDQMALPPCHVLHQYHVDEADGTLSMTMYQRSCDLFLGVPFNIASYALLLSLMAKVTNLRPGTLTMFLADVHIYENHIEQVKEQLSRMPLKAPTLVLPDLALNEDPMGYLERIRPDMIALIDYNPYPAIQAPMAV